MAKSRDSLHSGAGYLSGPVAIDRGATLPAGYKAYVHSLEAKSATNQLLAARDTAPSSQAFWEKVLIDVNRLDRKVTSEANTFFHMLVPVLLDTPGTEHAELRLRAATGAIHWLNLSNQFDDANRLSEATLAFARIHDDKLLLRRALNVSGIVHHYLGFKLTAMNRYVEAWRLALELSDPFRACSMAMHVGLVVSAAGMFSSATALWSALRGATLRIPDAEGHGYFQRALQANYIDGYLFVHLLYGLEEDRCMNVEMLADGVTVDLQTATMDVEINCLFARYCIASNNQAKARQLGRLRGEFAIESVAAAFKCLRVCTGIT